MKAPQVPLRVHTGADSAQGLGSDLAASPLQGSADTWKGWSEWGEKTGEAHHELAPALLWAATWLALRT